MDCLLLFVWGSGGEATLARLAPPLVAVLAAAGSAGDGSSCLDLLPLVVSLATAGSSEDNSSGFDRLDPPLDVSLAAGCSEMADSSGDGGRLDPRLFIFLTAGVLGFFAGAFLLTAVTLAEGADSFFEGDCFFAVVLGGAAAFLAGDFFARTRPLPLAFDWLVLRDFFGGGGRRALGGGLFCAFLGDGSTNALFELEEHVRFCFKLEYTRCPYVEVGLGEITVSLYIYTSKRVKLRLCGTMCVYWSS